MTGGSSRTQQTQQQTTLTENLNLQDIAGPAIVGDGNVITQTDQGAVAAAFEFGDAALQMGRDSFDASAQFAGRAGDQVGSIAALSLDNSRDALRDSLDFGDTVIDRFATFGDNALHSYGDISSDALARVSDSGRDALGFASSIFDRALGAQSDLADANLTGLTNLATQTSASSDDRVQKIALYAVGAVVAAMVLPRIFGKGA